MNECNVLLSNIDIFSVDKKIKELHKQNYINIQKIDSEISSLKEIKNSNTDLSYHIKRDIEDKIKKLEHQKSIYFEFDQNQNFYIMDFTELIEKYKNILSKPKNICFMSKSKNNAGNSIENNVFNEYIQILKKYNILQYIETEIKDYSSVEKKEKIKKCKNCKSKDFIYNNDQNAEICTTCGIQEEKEHALIQHKDSGRINISNKYSYERRVHFKDCINQWQGKQNSTIDPKIYEDLEKELEAHNLLNKSTNKKIKFERVTKEHILFFLKETGHSKHYEDVILIYHKLTGKEIDDISHLEDDLMEDFDKVSEAYDKLFKFSGKVDRKSFINTHFVFYQLLRKYKHPCDKKQFNMLKTLDRKSFHDSILQTIFTHLGWNFQSLF